MKRPLKPINPQPPEPTHQVDYVNVFFFFIYNWFFLLFRRALELHTWAIFIKRQPRYRSSERSTYSQLE